MRLLRSRTLNEELAARDPVTAPAAETAEDRGAARRERRGILAALGLLGFLVAAVLSVLGVIELVREMGIAVTILVVLLFVLFDSAVENDRTEQEYRGD